MVSGDITISPIGVFNISAAAMFAAALANITENQKLSGSQLVYVPVANGTQVAVYKEVRI